MATSAPIKSQKSELYWASAAAVATRAVAMVGFSGLGGARDQIDTSNLDNATDRTFVSGLGSPSPVTVAFNVHSDELSHTALLALKDSGAEVSWGIYSSHSATAPTVTTSVMQPVTTRASAIFQGYVSDINVDIGANDIWKGTITIQRTGAVTWKLATS
ncbi:phage tail tube protein [Variovorax saccharolyticus]|uniref:phage tail tube protein n=1 Tax=Variovorax saccharolyticus TaxID=3053516 RepID=UPI002577FD7E|nr:phage tail tube protein [Variovorax sp. J31P216]MDM0024076.1 phage tail tube protein [Variovorax sp. J31P216]